MSDPLSLFDARSQQRFFDRNALRGRELRGFWTDCFKRGSDPQERLLSMGSPERERFAERLDASPIELVESLDSDTDGATKLLFRNRAGDPFETVILRYPNGGRTTICVSSQSGCALRCAFCATGQMSRVRNLSADEIAAQALEAQVHLAPEGRAIKNVVFMGMGEPLQNESAVHRAIEAFTDGRLFNIHQERVLVSTVGLPDAMDRLHRKFPRVRIALSLHSADPVRRAELMPVAEKVSLDALRDAMDRLDLGPRGVFIEYILLSGFNDSEADADQLVRWLDGRPAHINVIPYNPVDGARLRTGRHLVASTREQSDRFAQRVRSAGYKVTRRFSQGRDIAAACGQLVKSKDGESR